MIGCRKLSATADNICTTHCFLSVEVFKACYPWGLIVEIFLEPVKLCSDIPLLHHFFLCIKIEIKKNANSGKRDSVVEE